MTRPNPYLKQSPGFETLERIKRWPGVKRNLLGLVYIYSGEHMAYWRPGGHGYTTHKPNAGAFALTWAIRRTRHCGPEKQIVFESLF